MFTKRHLNGTVFFSFRFSYVHKVLIALIFSSLGDALLNYGYFVYGMGAFAMAQIFYIMAFGFKPLKLWIGILLYLTAAATVSVLWKHLDAVILIGLPIYTMLLVTMCWRSLALLFVAKVCEELNCYFPIYPIYPINMLIKCCCILEFQKYFTNHLCDC